MKKITNLIHRVIGAPTIYILIILFVAAIAIRIIGINWGLPSQNYRHSAFLADEIGVLYASMLLGKGGYLIRNLQNYPTFYYLSFIFYGFYFLGGLLTGQFVNLIDFQTQYVQDISQFLLAGRFFIAFAGALTVLATYGLGKKAFNKQIGLIASLFLLFSFGHIVYSKVFRLDSFMPLLFVISFWLILRARDAPDNSLKEYVLCSIVLAITLAIKITAWAMIIPFLLLPFASREGFSLRNLSSFQFNRWFFALLVTFGLYVAMIAPVLVGMMEVMQSFAKRLSKSESVGNTAAISVYKYSFFWHIRHILPREMGVSIYPFSILGLVWMPFDKKHRSTVILLFALLISYFIPVGYATRTTWRDMLPILPFLSISAAYVIWNLFRLISLRFPKIDQKHAYATLIVFLMVLLTIPIYNISQQKRLILETDTRDIARGWIEENIPAHTTFAFESYGPGILNHRLQEEINESVAQLNGMEISSVWGDRPEYDVYRLDVDFRNISGEKDLLTPELLIPYLLANQIEYVVVSSGYYGRFYNDAVDSYYPERAVRGRAFHDVIENYLELEKAFVPNWQDTPGPIVKIYHVPPDLAVPDEYLSGGFDPFMGLEPPASAVGYYQFSPR